MTEDCTYFDKETSVRGELVTDDLILEGHFEGKILAKGHVLLKKSVQTNADITASKLLIEEGAIVNGCITMSNGKS